ncbi:MAG: hypothetical protein PVF74_13250 [Anaerolineales bacterium]
MNERKDFNRLMNTYEWSQIVVMSRRWGEEAGGGAGGRSMKLSNPHFQ